MSVAVPAPNAAGQEALVYSPVASKPESPKVPQVDASGEQRDQRDQERQEPKDHVSERLQAMARLAERRASKERNAVQAAPPRAEAAPSVQHGQALKAQAQHAAARTAANSASAELRSLSSTKTTAHPKPSSASAQPPLHAGSLPHPKPDAPPTAAPQAPPATAPVQSQDSGSPFAQALADAQVRRARQPGPAEVAGLPDALDRYDSNGDGRIDQGEMQQVYRANDERSSYAGLAQPQHPRPEVKDVFSNSEADQPQKLFDKQEVPLPGEPVAEFGPPLPGTVEAEPTYVLPGQEPVDRTQEVVLTPAERRALRQALEAQTGKFADEAPPLYVPPEDQVSAEDLVEAEKKAYDEEVLLPHKLFTEEDQIDQRDALDTYRQVSQGPSGRSSIIA